MQKPLMSGHVHYYSYGNIQSGSQKVQNILLNYFTKWF